MIKFSVYNFLRIFNETFQMLRVSCNVVNIFFVVLFGNIGSNLSLIKTAEASGSSEQEDTKRTEEQFFVAILPFYNTDNSGKNEINSDFTEALKKRIEKESPDLQIIILEKSTDHNGGIARSQGREVEANLVIYGETKSEKGKLEEITYYIVPLSGFEVDPFLLKNSKALAQLSARASYSTIEIDPLVLSEIDEENYSALLHAVISFKEYKKLDFKSALDSFQSIKNYEVNYQLLFYIANCYYFENKLNESCYFYEKALELEPQFKEAMLNQGNTFAFLGSPKTLHEGQKSLIQISICHGKQ